MRTQSNSLFDKSTFFQDQSRHSTAGFIPNKTQNQFDFGIVSQNSMNNDIGQNFDI